MLYFTSHHNGGGLLAIDPDDGAATEVLPIGTLPAGVSIGLYSTLPSLEVAGSCPGTLNVTVQGATFSGEFAIVRGLEPGESYVPAGVCAGTRLEVSDARPLARFITESDGTKSVTLETGPLDCGALLQPLDLTSCSIGDAIAVPE